MLGNLQLAMLAEMLAEFLPEFLPDFNSVKAFLTAFFILDAA